MEDQSEVSSAVTSEVGRLRKCDASQDKTVIYNMHNFFKDIPEQLDI
jgi:hypothetical protein